MVFDDETIQKLFGFEDAESESIERLKEYYFKKDTFDRVTAELPLRILVGHKGTGKFSYISKFHILISYKLTIYIVMCFYQGTN